MDSLLQQFKKRRLALGLKQNDMLMRVGVSRQQYQRLEAKGNPRLDTLELIAKGLSSKIALIPTDKLSAVLAVLESDDPALTNVPSSRNTESQKAVNSGEELSDDPWRGLLGDEQ